MSVIIAGGGGGNNSIAPAGFTRVAPNFVLAKPQAIIVPFYGAGIADNVCRNVSFVAALGAALGIAKYVLLDITLTIFSTGVIGNTSKIHGASYYSGACVTQLDLCDGEYYEANAIVVGTQVQNVGQKMIVPVDTLGFGRVKFSDSVAGATGNSVSAVLIGYWD